jgi:hypothetical protein
VWRKSVFDIYFTELGAAFTTVLPEGESLYSPGPVTCFSDEDDVSGNQNNCYWALHSESIARCKHHNKEVKKNVKNMFYQCVT